MLLPLLKKWSRLTLICHDVETLLSTCFLKVSVLPPMVYYLRIQPFPDREQFKNELCCFRLLHKFLTWHNLLNVLKFTLHVIIFFYYYYLICCCRLSCPGTSSLLHHKHVNNLRDFFMTGCSFFYLMLD